MEKKMKYELKELNVDMGIAEYEMYQNISEYDTPTITYIMYVNDVPIGYICIRTKIDDNWKKWSGNFYYAIRRN